MGSKLDPAAAHLQGQSYAPPANLYSISENDTFTQFKSKSIVTHHAETYIHPPKMTLLPNFTAIVTRHLETYIHSLKMTLLPSL